MNISILVTGCGGGGVGEQILKAVSMANGKRYYNIISTDTTNFCKAKFFGSDRFVKLPLANDISYIDRLLKICAIFKINAIFPGSEPEIKVLSKNRDLFKNIFLGINSDNVLNICFDKFKTNSFLRDNNFSYPKTELFKAIEDYENIQTSIDFPVIIKPYIGGRGSQNVFIAQNQKELNLMVDYIKLYENNVIVQEYIGTPDNEYTVGVLTSKTGDIINSIAVKRKIIGMSGKIKVKNITGRKDLGEYLVISSGISQGEIGRFQEVTRQCEEITEALGSIGPLNIQCRLVDNKVYPFEINPRLSGTTSLRAMVSYNEPDILLQEYFYGKLPKNHFEYISGNILRGLNEIFAIKEDCLDE